MSNKLTLKDVLSIGIKTLEEANIIEAKIDAWYLLEDYFGIDRAKYYMQLDREITSSKYEEYNILIQKRAHNIPLQYITNKQEFMGLQFIVSPAVLIPRQDTEVLVEEVMKEANGKEVLDLCTGSGCIITSLAKLCSLKRAVATDISTAALEIAKKNIINNQVQVTLVQSDMFKHVTETFDIIVSNPPYIPTKDIEELMPEVKEHEPRIALDGKEDGLYFYRMIIKQAKEYLNPAGQIFLEIGFDQGIALTNLLIEAEYTDISIVKDLSGLDRVVRARI